MIFVSVGTHPQSFSRLIEKIFQLVDEQIITEKVIIQSGSTPCTGKDGVDVIPFMDIDTFESTVKKSTLFVTHAGEGNIGIGVKLRKKMIIVPREKKYEEHTNDHQSEMAIASEKEGFGHVLWDMDQLALALKQTLLPNKTSNSFVFSYLSRMEKEHHLSSQRRRDLNKSDWIKPRGASIVVATLNGGEPLIKAVNGMLAQHYSGLFEIIVVDDGSFDGKTPELLKKTFGTNKKVSLIFLPRSGVCKARNAGIRAAKLEVVINMDHDCIPEKNWLSAMMGGFDSPHVGAVSAYGHYGGTSTGFRKDILEHLGGYDEDFFYYREDTDLSFRIMELGFQYQKVIGANYREDRTLVSPKGVGVLFYTLQRLRYHMNDVLLHKKHNTLLCNEFLHVKWGFFVDPVQDFKVATGLWNNGPFRLSSPRGLSFFEGKSLFSFAFIVMGGLVYVFGITLARLAGSIKHRHVLL